MKKSNKLLLGGFLAGLLLITILHVTLYAKYKAGNYTVYHAEDDMVTQSMQTFPNILFISLRNIPDATIRFSDVTQVPKGEEERIEYVQKGDTLLITGKNNDNERGMYYPIAFNLPDNATVSVLNSSLSIEAGKKLTVNSPVIYLQKSRAVFLGIENPLQVRHMKVVASDSSAAVFDGNTQVTHLEVQLSNSSLEYGEGNFGELSIVTDSLSRISLQSKHLLKAKIKTLSPE